MAQHVASMQAPPAQPAAEPRILNVNVGVLGHVDSGKTSLVAALSTTLSTAALDKHPQSKERGITLDLGFSSFKAPLPPHLAHLPYDELQFTLVDCPGHASLIRTIIGGVQIIDMMVLVIDITKGLQAQTAECLVVGEIATPRLVVALNKVDLLPAADRAKAIRKAQKRLAATFNLTTFAGVEMVPVCARPGAMDAGEAGEASGSGAAAPGPADAPAYGVEDLKVRLLALVPAALRAPAGRPFLFAVDHCFPVKGQGTVLTGTVLQGSLSVGDTFELPALRLSKQAKSLQCFRRPVGAIQAGDRAGIRTTQLDAKLLERGLAAAPGSVPTFSGAVAAVEKIRFYSDPVLGRTKYHVCVGHTTVLAECRFFGVPDGGGTSREAALQQLVTGLQRVALHEAAPAFDWAADYLHQDELFGLEGRPLGSSGLPASGAAAASDDGQEARHHGPQWALLRFEQPVTAPADSTLIGARFDLDQHGESCRLAFYGRLLAPLDPADAHQLQKLRVYKVKERRGVIERVAPDGMSAICKGMFKKETDMAIFEGLAVETGLGEAGRIEGRFGGSGKFKVAFGGAGLAGDKAARAGAAGGNAILLRYKKYLHEPDKHRVRQ